LRNPEGMSDGNRSILRPLVSRIHSTRPLNPSACSRWWFSCSVDRSPIVPCPPKYTEIFPDSSLRRCCRNRKQVTGESITGLRKFFFPFLQAYVFLEVFGTCRQCSHETVPCETVSHLRDGDKIERFIHGFQCLNEIQ